MVHEPATSLIPIERIANRIYLIRGMKVMLDRDLATLYNVETKYLKRQVRRNSERFPDDFMFELSKEEFHNWRSQFVTSNSSTWMGLRYPPFAFTEHGVLMLSSVLNSERATKVNIQIMRTFTRLREMLASNEELARKVSQHDRQIALLFDHVKKLLQPPDPPKKRPMGFIHPKDDDEDT